MALMDKETQKQVRELLSVVKSPVTIQMFTQEFECGYCRETRQIVEEVAELSDQVTVQIHDFQAENEEPQPQVVVALGLRMTNWAPSNPSV